VESPHTQYRPDERVPITVSVTNPHPVALTLRACGWEPDCDAASTGTTTPAFDLVLTSGMNMTPDVDPCCRRNIEWKWSDHAQSPPTELTLQPGETRVIIDTAWQPSDSKQFGSFEVRLGQEYLLTLAQIPFRG
jgi:hypothetical protein